MAGQQPDAPREIPAAPVPPPPGTLNLTTLAGQGEVRTQPANLDNVQVQPLTLTSGDAAAVITPQTAGDPALAARPTAVTLQPDQAAAASTEVAAAPAPTPIPARTDAAVLPTVTLDGRDYSQAADGTLTHLVGKGDNLWRIASDIIKRKEGQDHKATVKEVWDMIDKITALPANENLVHHTRDHNDKFQINEKTTITISADLAGPATTSTDAAATASPQPQIKKTETAVRTDAQALTQPTPLPTAAETGDRVTVPATRVDASAQPVDASKPPSVKMADGRIMNFGYDAQGQLNTVSSASDGIFLKRADGDQYFHLFDSDSFTTSKHPDQLWRVTPSANATEFALVNSGGEVSQTQLWKYDGSIVASDTSGNVVKVEYPNPDPSNRPVRLFQYSPNSDGSAMQLSRITENDGTFWQRGTQPDEFVHSSVVNGQTVALQDQSEFVRPSINANGDYTLVFLKGSGGDFLRGEVRHSNGKIDPLSAAPVERQANTN